MSSRDLLDRRRSAGRIVAVVAGVLALLLGVTAALGLWLLPPVLACTPRERLTTAAPTVTVHDGTTAATVTPGAGWLLLGVGPFLPTDAQTLVSPDDAYRLVVTLAPVPAPLAGADPTSPPGLEPDALEALLARTGAADAASAGDAAPTDPSPTGAASAGPSPAGSGASGASGAPHPVAEWSREVLANGVTVSYADIVRGSDTTTVALVAPPAETAGAPALALVATVPTADAARYRTATADLASTAVFAPASTVTQTPTATATSTGARNPVDGPAARDGRGTS
jgi:hypothetical protein